MQYAQESSVPHEPNPILYNPFPTVRRLENFSEVSPSKLESWEKLPQEKAWEILDIYYHSFEDSQFLLM